MKHSIIALERALADTRNLSQFGTDTTQIEALALANIKLREELQRRCKEVNDLLIARNLPMYNDPEDEELVCALGVSHRHALQQLQDVSAQNEELTRQLQHTRLQLNQERRRREQVEEEVRSLRRNSGAGTVTAAQSGGGRGHDSPPPYSPGHGINPSIDSRGTLLRFDVAGAEGYASRHLTVLTQPPARARSGGAAPTPSR